MPTPWGRPSPNATERTPTSRGPWRMARLENFVVSDLETDSPKKLPGTGDRRTQLSS